MSKILRLFTVSLLLAIMMITTVAGGVFADDPIRDRDCEPNGNAQRVDGGPK
ncbi:hypothetical protein ACFLX3_03035 [Chloroflexota bacterium]